MGKEKMRRREKERKGEKEGAINFYFLFLYIINLIYQ